MPQSALCGILNGGSNSQVVQPLPKSGQGATHPKAERRGSAFTVSRNPVSRRG